MTAPALPGPTEPQVAADDSPVSAPSLSVPEAPDTAWERSESSVGLRLFALALQIVPFALGVLMVLEWIKDDAYISFRYAHNLVVGAGLVFNTGEHVEGITNFLWTLVLAPFEALGLDLFQVCEVLGSALGVSCIVLTTRLTTRLNGERHDLGELWGALWLATSSSFVLYAKSGLEQPLAAFLPLCAALLLYRARSRKLAGARDVVMSYLASGLMLGAACITRPELHMLAALIAIPLAYDIARARSVGKAELWLAGGILAVTVPSHAFRYLYYGSLFPNTFFVKTGGGDESWVHGVQSVRDMLSFNHTGVLMLLAPFALLSRKHLTEKITCLVIALAFAVYYAGVGVDEMQWHRLYIPALPFLCAVAAVGAQNVIARVAGIWPSRTDVRSTLSTLAWAGVVALCGTNLRYTYDQMGGFNGHGDLAGTYHPDMGKFIVRHERPGALVAFQDMGSTPYHAPDINFLDFFGLVDHTVAHARHDAGLHTFIAGSATDQRAFDAKMRDYFFERNPEWAIMTIYPPRWTWDQTSKLYEKDPSGGAFGNLFRENPVQFALWDDPRFRARYVPVRTWPRSIAYYLTLFRRRDLWEQTPKEVVLDAPPTPPAQMIARFEGGLELLGSKITSAALERHEAFFTTWWRLPGPMERDLTFFVHVSKAGFQTPADHVPGDWMYPADRWKAGQILEDRILFQVPPIYMTAGDYQVHMGAYRRSTGERLRIVSGKNDGQNRVHLGSLRVSPLYPLVHHLIPPTDVSTMRKHGDRIADSKRAPGT